MNKKLYTSILVILFAFLFSGCQPVELTPIIIRVTATPAPRTATPVPEPTEVPTQAAAEPTEDTSGTESGGEQESPTEAPMEEEVEGVDVTFQFVTPLQTIEELEPFILKAEALDGVLTAAGNEKQITITYNPDVTDVATLMTGLEQAGKAVEEPEG